MWELPIPFALIGASALTLAGIWLYYWLDDRSKKKRAHRRRNIDKGSALLNKLVAARNDEFAGVIPGTCGQIRPGEWQCNCADPDNGCLVLKKLRSQAEPSEEKTNRRAAIMAQKARKAKNEA